ncbi:uncharacterized protein BX663DRAFT_515082 [Cokeromyces recurvatus]|uniref:uncharacterized protein n=1 Tax=Cokeromyces recurvatus TaxID=90255 RepID=UPI00221FA59F|nr:uncharacterized protein BX663DRAFT_515082 [Cokeromyces recurvatus]KAI7901141.1 hypothetical protein BX663DRAFT_515082 [Cokeromyces recurvatus]
MYYLLHSCFFLFFYKSVYLYIFRSYSTAMPNIAYSRNSETPYYDIIFLYANLWCPPFFC